MKMIDVKNGPQNISRIILGCMRMPALSVDEAAKVDLTHNEWYQLYLASGKFLP